MPTLHEYQVLFARRLGPLIAAAFGLGYEVTLGECYRTPEQAAANAASGSGIANSLHCSRLAVDLCLFRDGIYLADTVDYLPLGEQWEAVAPECRWGGRFGRADGNHFSMTWEGRS